jgi:hypothetical protein
MTGLRCQCAAKLQYLTTSRGVHSEGMVGGLHHDYAILGLGRRTRGDRTSNRGSQVRFSLPANLVSPNSAAEGYAFEANKPWQMKLALPMPCQASSVHLAPCVLIVLAVSVSGRSHTRLRCSGASPTLEADSGPGWNQIARFATGVPFQNEA